MFILSYVCIIHILVSVLYLGIYFYVSMVYKINMLYICIYFFKAHGRFIYIPKCIGNATYLFSYNME